jgi:hypothetical protein
MDEKIASPAAAIVITLRSLAALPPLSVLRTFTPFHF